MTRDKTVVCNAGPLIVLAKLNALHLLEKLYNRVHIAEAVFDEVIVEGLRHGYTDARTAQIFSSGSRLASRERSPGGFFYFYR